MKTDELATGSISMQSKVVHEASLCVVAVTREVSVSTHTTASRIVRHVRHGFLGGGSSNVLQRRKKEGHKVYCMNYNGGLLRELQR